MTDNLGRIDTMVNLYIPPLKQGFLEYKQTVMSSVVLSFKVNPPEVGVMVNYPNNLEESTSKFRQSLASLLIEKGYSYF
jgi:hypothetical protein